MLLSRVVPYGLNICRLPARSLAVLCGSRTGRAEIHRPLFSEALTGLISRTADVPLQIPVTRYSLSTRASGWLPGYRFHGIRSGAAGIDIEVVS